MSEWNNGISITLQKMRPRWSATVTRHLTPEEIALNQQELTCRAEIEKLETQEAALDYELEQDIDDSRRMLAVHTLRILYKALLTQHRELARIKDAQKVSLARASAAMLRRVIFTGGIASAISKPANGDIKTGRTADA